jgi:hypothetical protein
MVTIGVGNGHVSKRRALLTDLILAGWLGLELAVMAYIIILAIKRA